MAQPESGDDLITRLLRVEQRLQNLSEFIEDSCADPESALLERVERLSERLELLDGRLSTVEARIDSQP